MANISTELADLTISRQLVLQRLSNGLSKQVADHYEAMIDDIRTTILKNGVISNHLKQTINDIKEQLTVPNFDKDFKDLAQQEVNYTQKAYNSAIGIDVFKNIPPESAMNAILNTSLIEGASIGLWMKDLEASQAFDVERAIKMGMTLGETNNQLAQRVVNTMGVSMRNAQTIVKTGTATVANQARMEFYQANEDDVIKGYQWHATLDSRTRLEHAARDGAAWDTNKKGLNEKGKKYPFKYTPFGWNCRCQLVPVLKTWREMGIDEDELPEGTRSSLDGYVPQTTTFDKWIEGKSEKFKEDYLGKGRYNLYKDGKITFSDLVRQDGRTLTIKELGEMSVPKVVKVPDISFGYGGKFDGYVKDIRPEAKMVIDRLPKPYEIKDLKSGAYYAIDEKLHTGQNRHTFLHEYGHHLDYKLNKSNDTAYSVTRLLDSLGNDAKHLGIKNTKERASIIESFKEKFYTKEKRIVKATKKHKEYIGTFNTPNFEQVKAYSDIIDAMLGGKGYKYYSLHGHGTAYYGHKGAKEKETFANLFAIWADGTKWDEAKGFFPSLTTEFEKIMKEAIL